MNANTRVTAQGLGCLLGNIKIIKASSQSSSHQGFICWFSPLVLRPSQQVSRHCDRCWEIVECLGFPFGPVGCSGPVICFLCFCGRACNSKSGQNRIPHADNMELNDHSKGVVSEATDMFLCRREICSEFYSASLM